MIQKWMRRLWALLLCVVLVTGTKTIGNKTYEFDSGGVCLNP